MSDVSSTLGGNLDEKSCFFRAQSVEDVGRRGEGGQGEGEQSSVGALTGRGADRPRRGLSLKCVSTPEGERRRREKLQGERKGEELQKLDKQASPEKRSCKSGLHAEEKRKGAGLWCELGETGKLGLVGTGSLGVDLPHKFDLIPVCSEADPRERLKKKKKKKEKEQKKKNWTRADQKGPDTHQLSFSGVKACLALCAYSGRGSPPPTHPAGVERGMWSSDCHSSVSSASAQPHMHIGRVENKPPLLASPQI
ncbi:hypothetical protein F7725_009146 [Dissostichus mawsoni]|uniref:Uncharacterized protein n=1 Tax=Dissostichus mawsoni TaxID=36200 RepID=A0A7J5Z9B1_DISMA|nr:hypothetical protein F7725_009146 [Dissostichus mawsoni]